MRCALTFGAGNGIIFESSEDFGGAAQRSEALFFKSGICAFSRRSRRRISPPAGIGQKAEARRKAGTGLRFAAGLVRVAAMRGPLDSRRPCTMLFPQERQRRLRPLRGIYEAVCPLPRPESRSRLGASAGQGAPAEAISRRMSYHVHTYIRSRAGCSIARYAYTLADGTDPLPKLLMLNCASARISCIDFDCSARRASQNEAKALCCARAHIRSDADGPPDR